MDLRKAKPESHGSGPDAAAVSAEHGPQRWKRTVRI